MAFIDHSSSNHSTGWKSDTSAIQSVVMQVFDNLTVSADVCLLSDCEKAQKLSSTMLVSHVQCELQASWNISGSCGKN